LSLGIVGECMGYPCVELEVGDAKRVLEAVSKALGYSTNDLEDAIRIIDNFDEYYRYSTRKFKEYLVPEKREGDLIRGRVIVDRLKLIRSGDRKRVLVIFDRRIDRELIKRVVESTLAGRG